MKLRSCLLFSLLALSALVGILVTIPNPPGLQARDVGKVESPPDLFAMGINLDRLAGAQLIQFPRDGIEDVVVDSKGNIYTAIGYNNSEIYMVRPSNLSQLNLIGRDQNQIIGISLSPDETKLAFASQNHGVKVLDLKTGIISSLVSEYKGVRLSSVNAVTFSDEDNIYFTAGDIVFSSFHLDIVSKGPSGRIFHYNIKEKELRIVQDGLSFPNGITYSKKDNCLYVNHLNMYEVLKISLAPNSQGYSVVAPNLPGYPDNLKITEDNKLWVAIPSLRDSLTNFLDNTPLVRKAIINTQIPLVVFLALANTSLAGAIKIDPSTGQVEDYFFGKSDQIKFVTGAFQRGNKLYMCSLFDNFIAVMNY